MRLSTHTIIHIIGHSHSHCDTPLGQVYSNYVIHDSRVSTHGATAFEATTRTADPRRGGQRSAPVPYPRLHPSTLLIWREHVTVTPHISLTTQHNPPPLSTSSLAAAAAAHIPPSTSGSRRVEASESV